LKVTTGGISRGRFSKKVLRKSGEILLFKGLWG
jgi:hypothetical protein